MAENQNVKTYYKPKSKAYRQTIPASQQDARDLRAQKRNEQTRAPSPSSAIGDFLRRGIGNFKENMNRPIARPDEQRHRQPPQRQQRERIPEPFVGSPFPQMGGMGGFGGGGDLDLSAHPDPMVNRMYRGESPERTVRKKKGGATEIHYHYH